MKQHRLAKTWGIAALTAVSAIGTGWRYPNAAYAVTFEPPTDQAPHSTTGGASRSSVFTPPNDLAPVNTTGGSSRGGFFTPPADNATPQNGTAGASRGNFFAPPADNAAPHNAAGGASRSDSFAPPPENATPQNTSGGAARGEGLARSNVYGVTYSPEGVTIPAMMAVMPDTFYGTTLEARPTVLVYTPASNAEEAIFSLKDEAKNMVYQMPVAIPAGGGVMAIELPADAPELAVGENYQWYVAMKLDNELSPASPFVDGWISRIAPEPQLTTALSQGDALAKVEALGAHGIWYDTAAQLALLKEADGSEVMSTHWYELLEAVGLAEIASAPIDIVE